MVDVAEPIWRLDARCWRRFLWCWSSWRLASRSGQGRNLQNLRNARLSGGQGISSSQPYSDGDGDGDGFCSLVRAASKLSLAGPLSQHGLICSRKLCQIQSNIREGNMQTRERA